MFSPSAAPLWKSTTKIFRPPLGVAATARVRKEGSALKPSIASPPCFKKNRRVESIVNYSLTPLELGRAERQACYHARVHRIAQLLFQRAASLWRNLPCQEEIDGLRVDARASHAIAG